MAIQLRANEEVKVIAHLHWTAYFWPGLWACFFGLAFLGSLAKPDTRGSSIWYFVVAGIPIFYRWLQNKCKSYVITNQRVYVEEGIIAKSKKDIPLHKINDFEMSQGIIQRISGAGDIRILTGNDKGTRIKYIHCPEEFRTAASQLIATRTAS